MNFKEQLFSDLKPEFQAETTDINEAINHLNEGGEVYHDGKEVFDLTRISLDLGFGIYKGHMSGDWMNGIFILK